MNQSRNIDTDRICPIPVAAGFIMRVPYNFEDIDVNPRPEIQGQNLTPRNHPSFRFEESRLDSDAPRLILYGIYWPIYLIAVCPFQLLFMWIKHMKKMDRYSLAGRLKLLGHAIIDAIMSLAFFQSIPRAIVYIRASWLKTPTQVIPWLSGDPVIPADPTTKSPPQPDNWEEIRVAVLKRDDFSCTICGISADPNKNTVLDVDHIIPRSRGGADTGTNLRTLCMTCHEARHGRLFWRRRMEQSL